VPEHSKKLAGFEALYKVDQDKRQQQQAKDTAAAGSAEPEQTERAAERTDKTASSTTRKESTDNKVSKSESKNVRNITSQNIDVFEPATFKADRRKVKALKRLALDLEPARKLQDLFDEALSDILAKYGRSLD
jgi:FtsZ-interacting cell division protein YlmF